MGGLMKYRRYGKFRFSDYITTWVAFAFFMVLIVFALLTNTPHYWLILPLLFSIYMVWSVYQPNSEYFLIDEDTITIMRGRKRRKVSIPSESILVVSYADVCSSLTKSVSYGNQTYMLKGRYAISILHKIPLESVLEELHSRHATKYTNTAIEVSFNEQYPYVYSFVCNQAILDKLIDNGTYQIIIPETLLKQISIDSDKSNVHIDWGY
jgi:hypothetical protein